MKFKVGDKVRLRKGSEYWGQSDDTTGVIIDVDEIFTELPYEVKWGNGMNHLCYGEEDLEPATTYAGSELRFNFI